MRAYRNDEYKATLKIFYDEIKVKKFLSDRKIFLFLNQKILQQFFIQYFSLMKNYKILDDNYFYHQWNEIKIKNESNKFCNACRRSR